MSATLSSRAVVRLWHPPVEDERLGKASISRKLGLAAARAGSERRLNGALDVFYFGY